LPELPAGKNSRMNYINSIDSDNPNILTS